jgi:quinolinate synthase
LADDVGSTEYIIKRIEESPAGSQWAVGTEIHLVNRLAAEHTDRKIIPLDDCVCMCSTMYRISPQHLCWTLESLVEGEVVNQVGVDPETKRWARVALERMLESS